ncbi:MAG: mRNA interferase MazF2 [Acidobacteria bacterium]|nr:MAG: mRNA interferase MazF2 [Acidobacteriota bacterium]
MTVQRGDLWWADLGEPRGSEPAMKRPVLVVQADAFNRSNIRTIVVVSLTTNLKHAAAPGNVTCRPRATGLRPPSVVNVSQVSTLDRQFLRTRIGSLPLSTMREVEDGLKLVLGL